MRYLEVRRHSTRAKPGVHLSPAGIERAQRVAHMARPFARVVTSPVTRAYETAVAMGLVVDEQDERLATMASDVDLELPWPFSFAEAAAAVGRGGAAARFAARQAQVWRSVVQSAPDDGSILIITHGRHRGAGRGRLHATRRSHGLGRVLRYPRRDQAWRLMARSSSRLRYSGSSRAGRVVEDDCAET